MRKSATLWDGTRCINRRIRDEIGVRWWPNSIDSTCTLRSGDQRPRHVFMEMEQMGLRHGTRFWRWKWMETQVALEVIHYRSRKSWRSFGGGGGPIRTAQCLQVGSWGSIFSGLRVVVSGTLPASLALGFAVLQDTPKQPGKEVGGSVAASTSTSVGSTAARTVFGESSEGTQKGSIASVHLANVLRTAYLLSGREARLPGSSPICQPFFRGSGSPANPLPLARVHGSLCDMESACHVHWEGFLTAATGFRNRRDVFSRWAGTTSTVNPRHRRKLRPRGRRSWTRCECWKRRMHQLCLLAWPRGACGSWPTTAPGALVPWYLLDGKSKVEHPSSPLPLGAFPCRLLLE